MNNSKNMPIAYHARWRVPEYSSVYQKVINKDYMGTLYYYGNKDSVLELYIVPPIISESISDSNIVFGLDADKRKFSIFNAKSVHAFDFRKFVFKAEYFVIGYEPEPVKSPHEKLYTRCYVEYPYLRNWAFNNVFQQEEINKSFTWNISNGLNFVAEIEEGIRLRITSSETHKKEEFKFSIEQTTKIYFDSDEPQSIYKFTTLIAEFSRFLSIATFSKHSPTAVFFNRKDARYPHLVEQLMFPVKTTEMPQGNVIKFDKIVVRKPGILRRWHECYEQMSPITKYLEQTVTEQKDEFDSPDFLIIAQALDGYYKRFVNKKDGKDIRKYKEQIERLLEHFKGVHLLEMCNLDAEILTHSRHKYSHLIPDNETKNVEKAVDGEELYYLTKKCIVLLTCCILDNLGLTIDEINVCFEDSVIEEIVNDIPFWYLKKSQKE